MIERITAIDRSDPRIAFLSQKPLPEKPGCVLWWMSRSQRATNNQTGNLAIAIANELGLPVVAVFCMAPVYPRATLRAYHFMAEGLATIPDRLAERGVGWILRVGEPERIVPEVAKQCGAAVVVADFDPLAAGRTWRQQVADRIAVSMVTVDSDTVVPSSLFPKEEWAPRTIRPKIHRLLPEFLQPIPNPVADRRSSVCEAHDPLTVIRTLPLDQSVGPSTRFQGGSDQAHARLQTFLTLRLAGYADGRNHADRDGTSELSPYLHFGQISPLEIALKVIDADAPPESVDAFINEMVVQRELAINFALRNPDYDQFAGLPDWGRKTLREHAADPRPVRYDRATLEAGRTNDPLWNAAQVQMVREGWMPNRLRMYWAKQLLLWTESPEIAFETAKTFNDRYFLDGRDANGYAGIAWSIGGRHDRPFPPNRAISGLVRPMGSAGMRRHFDVDAYISQVNRRFG